jgi:hypothetical protein
LVETKEYVLTANDRCDAGSCGAQAYVLIRGISGELTFCAHHYNKLDGDKLQAFSFETIDERDRLIENRSIGSEN